MCIRTLKLTLFILSCATMMMLGASLACADAVLVGQVNMAGTGFGHVNTILTVQALGQGMGGTESGCVGLNSSGAQIDGPSACQGINAAGTKSTPTSSRITRCSRYRTPSRLPLCSTRTNPAAAPSVSMIWSWCSTTLKVRSDSRLVISPSRWGLRAPRSKLA